MPVSLIYNSSIGRWRLSKRVGRRYIYRCTTEVHFYLCSGEGGRVVIQFGQTLFWWLLRRVVSAFRTVYFMILSLTCLCIFIHYEYLERQEWAKEHKLCRKKEKNIIKFFVKTKIRETVLQGRCFIAYRFIWVLVYSQREMGISGVGQNAVTFELYYIWT